MLSERTITHRENPTVPAAPGLEIRSLTGLRAVAAVWVVAYHFFRLPPGATWYEYLEPLRPLITAGWLGVDLFFVLSGFVLTLTYLDQVGRRPTVGAAAAFYWKRISRIWPLATVVTLGFAAWLVVKHVLGGGAHVHRPWQPDLDVLDLLAQVFMVQIWFTPDFNGTSVLISTWSLSAEWLAYVCFPVLALALYRMRSLPAAVLGGGGGGAVAVLLPFAYISYSAGINHFAWSWLLRIAGAFLAGALVCLCVQRVPVTRGVRRWASSVATAAIVGILLVAWWSALRGGGYAGVAVLLMPVLVGALALGDRGPARRLARPALVLGGRISYALYLVHLAIFEVFWTAMDSVAVLAPGGHLATLLAPAVLVSTVPAAYLLWRYVEEPAQARMRRRSPVRSRPTVHTAAAGAGDRPAQFAPDVPVPRHASVETVANR